MNCSFSLLCSLLFTVILRMTLLSGVFARSSLFLKKRYWICTIILSAALFLIAYLSLIHGRSDDDLVVFVLQTGSVFAFFMAVLEGEWTHSIFYTILFLTLENSAGILSDVVFNDSDLVLYGSGSLISDLCKWFIELIRYGMPYALMYQLEIHICGVSLARKAKGMKMACLLAGILLFAQMEIAELCSSIFLNITFREIWKTALLPGFLIALLPGIILYIYHNSQELWQMENELAMQQAMADIQKQHLEEVISFRDANMIMNHSIVEHLRMIERCLSRGHTETAAQYLQDSLQLYQSGRNDVFYSSNPILDAVIRYKAAFNPDYTFTCRSMVSDSLNINQIDLGILLMNMIDERIRGIERHGFRKEINIMSWQKGSLVFQKADSEWVKGESLEPEHTILQHVAERNHGYIEKGVYSPTDLCAYISG